MANLLSLIHNYIELTLNSHQDFFLRILPLILGRKKNSISANARTTLYVTLNYEIIVNRV